MLIGIFDDVIKDPKQYVEEIHEKGFEDVDYSGTLFRNIQSRDGSDLMAKCVEFIFPDYYISMSFVRKSPLDQVEPNYIHSDEKEGDITCILYLSENAPDDDGTTIYDDEGRKAAVLHSKFNRMVTFQSALLHSRNIYDNFGTGKESRLIQVIFLKRR
jgi:hypothetical protein